MSGRRRAPQFVARRSRALALATFGVMVAVARPGGAEDAAPMALDFAAEPGLVHCPTADEFRQQVVRQIGRDPFRDEAPRRMVVRFYAAGSRLEARIEWRDAGDQWEGERTFASRDDNCTHMARAVAFAAAIQIQLMAGPDRAAVRQPPVEVAPPNPPPPVVAIEDARPPPPPPPEPFLAVDAGIGAVADLGDGPMMAVPRIAFWFGRASRASLRVAASGLGPGAEVSGVEGTAHLDLALATLEVVRSFRRDRWLQPLLAVGAGLQEVRVHGISARPDLAAAHDGHTLSGLLTASGGLTFALASRLALIAEVQAMLFRPTVNVQIGSSRAAALDGAAIFLHGGLLARF